MLPWSSIRKVCSPNRPIYFSPFLSTFCFSCYVVCLFCFFFFCLFVVLRVLFYHHPASIILLLSLLLALLIAIERVFWCYSLGERTMDWISKVRPVTVLVLTENLNSGSPTVISVVSSNPDLLRCLLLLLSLVDHARQRVFMEEELLLFSLSQSLILGFFDFLLSLILNPKQTLASG